MLESSFISETICLSCTSDYVIQDMKSYKPSIKQFDKGTMAELVMIRLKGGSAEEKEIERWLDQNKHETKSSKKR